MLTDSFADWKLVLLPQETVYPGGSPHFNAVYRAWKTCWEPVYQSVGVKGSLFSDAFTRQYDRLAIFYRGECAALTLFNRADLSREHHKDDSYFGFWPELALRGLMRQGSRILVCSAFSVTQEFRRGTFDFDVKNLLLGSIVRYFVDSPFDAMTALTRNLKGIHEACYQWGARPLMKDVTVHGEPADLMGFFKPYVNLRAIPELTELLDHLWKNRIIDANTGSATIPFVRRAA